MVSPTSQNRWHGRVRALDALRGLAAVGVVFAHCWPGGRPDGLWWWLTRATPVGVLRDGRASVILFFVLSGFALSLAVEAEVPFSYPSFLVRRFCRIYLPFAVAILLAAALSRLLVTGPLPGALEQYNEYWVVGLPTWDVLRDHLLMLGRQSDTVLDAPVWSLAHELRISIIFPLLYIAQRAGLAVPITAAALTLVVAMRYGAVGSDVVPLYSNTVRGSVEPTAYHLLFFTFGIATAQHRTTVLRLVAYGRWMLWIAVLLAFSLRWPSRLVTDVQYGLGSTLAIWLVTTSPRSTRFLEMPVLQWLGRISYSLYLTHMIVLLAVLHGLYSWVEPRLLVWTVPLLSMPVAALFHALVEAPAIRFARASAVTLNHAGHGLRVRLSAFMARKPVGERES